MWMDVEDQTNRISQVSNAPSTSPQPSSNVTSSSFKNVVNCGILWLGTELGQHVRELLPQEGPWNDQLRKRQLQGASHWSTFCQPPACSVSLPSLLLGLPLLPHELSVFRSFFKKYFKEKEMATHSSVLAWRIPGTGEPGGLPSMGSHRVGHY